MPTHLLSKSSFIKGLQCDKHLYLYKYHYNEMDELSEMQKAIFQRGTNVGVLAQQLFPGGVDTSPKNHFDYNNCLKKTAKEIKSGSKTIYEAGFQFNEVLVIADIVVKSRNSWKVYEVKSSTSISETYLNDAALQYYVLSNSGLKIKDFSIVYLNNQYIRNGELDINALFIVESVLQHILPLRDFVQENVERLKKVLLKKRIPDIDIGEHCYNPYICGFYNYCRKHIPEDSIFDLSGMHLNKKYDLYRDGIIELDDVPEDYPLNYPLYFMDFETFQPAVPLFDNSKPYQQIPFQYSIHYKKTKNSELIHSEFLADAGEDPRKKFIENLLEATEKPGDIVAYNKAFEITRLKEIARDFPEYSEEIEERILRIKDLMLPFQRNYYYAPEMKGSYSIKYVLPALVPELSYDELEIKEGGLASIAFESLWEETDMMYIAEIKEHLLEYCKLDTLAMVRILERLENL
ncbi:MAG: DUF2779 domain-containing protein [Ignavibacteriaceae bacterium]